MEESAKPLAQFTTNSFVENPYLVMSIGFAAGMGAMWTGIVIGVHPYMSVALLLGGILLVFGYLIGKVQYTLNKDGVQQQIRRFIPYFLHKKVQLRFFTWKQIQSYKNDTDRMRSGKEYEFLKLYLNTSPGEIWITDQHDAIGFQQFKEAFLNYIRDDNNWAKSTSQVSIGEPNMLMETNESIPGRKSQIPEQPGVQPLTRHIRERKGFYKTAFAKFITIFFTLITLFLIWNMSYHGMRFNNWYKVMYVILPGTVFMLYRVFFCSPIKNDDNQ
jgi:hypothetical protein